MMQTAKVALVHDYLVERGGGEKVLAALHQTFPEAPIYTSLYNPDTTLDVFRRADVRTSFLQRLTTNRRRYRALLPLYPLAFRSFALRGYDVVISNSTGFAKGVRAQAGARHVCYCHTPPRFLWGYQRANESEHFSLATRFALRAMRPLLPRLDREDAAHVDRFVANSRGVRDRIQEVYKRKASILHPPIECAEFAPAAVVGEFFLVVSRLVPYKRLDIVIDAFNQNRLPLLVVGDGRARRQLQARVRSERIRFSGYRSQGDVRELLATCRALIVPGAEDFGMSALEANASGRPVIAYGAGGACETVVPNVTGVLFAEQTVGSLLAALDEFAVTTFDAQVLTRHARTFDKPRFQDEIRAIVEEELRSVPVPVAGTSRRSVDVAS